VLTPRANIHHSRLPAPGAVGHIVGLSTIDPQRKCIVSHYPLCDNVLPYSIGIHTVYVRFLDNREALCVSGIWFREALP
jgi:hypothetical protein